MNFCLLGKPLDATMKANHSALISAGLVSVKREPRNQSYFEAGSPDGDPSSAIQPWLSRTGELSLDYSCKTQTSQRRVE